MSNPGYTLLGPDQVAEILKALRVSANNYHAQQTSDSRFLHIATSHTGKSYKTCKAFACRDAWKVVQRYEGAATPENHNPYALRQYRRNIQKASQTMEQYLT